MQGSRWAEGSEPRPGPGYLWGLGVDEQEGTGQPDEVEDEEGAAAGEARNDEEVDDDEAYL